MWDIYDKPKVTARVSDPFYFDKDPDQYRKFMDPDPP